MRNFKKWICVFTAAMMLFAMTACGATEPETQTVVLAYEQEGTVINYQLDAEGDIVQTLTQTSTLDCSAYTDDQMTAILSSLDQFKDTYADIEGVTYTTNQEGDTIVEKIVIDATNADTLSTLSEQGLLPIDGSASRISLEKTVESLKEQGWTVKE
ncbi:MAG: DUF1307 domain-containing protein [Faecalimonas sp.]|nr:DUF1307 domain-containing protein [Faecalimonas sp.]